MWNAVAAPPWAFPPAVALGDDRLPPGRAKTALRGRPSLPLSPRRTNINPPSYSRVAILLIRAISRSENRRMTRSQRASGAESRNPNAACRRRAERRVQSVCSVILPAISPNGATVLPDERSGIAIVSDEPPTTAFLANEASRTAILSNEALRTAATLLRSRCVPRIPGDSTRV